MDKNNVPDNLPTGSSSPLAGASPDLHTNSNGASASNPQFIGMPTRSALGSTHANSTVPDYSSPSVPAYKPEEISKTSISSSVIPKPAQPAVTPVPSYMPPAQAKPVSSSSMPSSSPVTPAFVPKAAPVSMPHVPVGFDEKPKVAPTPAATPVTPSYSQTSTYSSSTYSAPTSSYAAPSSSQQSSGSSYGTSTPAYTAAQKAALEAASAASLSAAAAQSNRSMISSQPHPMKNIWIAIATLVVLLLLGGAFAYYYYFGIPTDTTVVPAQTQTGQNNGSSFPAGVRPATTTGGTNPSGAFSKSNRDLITDYIKANINTLSPKKASPAFAVTSISFDGPDRALVDYTNGRVSYTAAAVATVDSAGKVRISSFIILEK